MKNKTFVPLFTPALFCAIISVMALFMGENAKPAFFAFLPMCFLFVGFSLVAMNKRITDLEDKLKQAKQILGS